MIYSEYCSNTCGGHRALYRRGTKYPDNHYLASLFRVSDYHAFQDAPHTLIIWNDFYIQKDRSVNLPTATCPLAWTLQAFIDDGSLLTYALLHLLNNVQTRTQTLKVLQ